MRGPDSGHGCTGADGNPQYLRHTETAVIALERPPRADGRQAAIQTTHTEMSPRVSADKEAKSVTTRTLKTTLKRLQINPANGEDLARDRPGGQGRQTQRSTKATASPPSKPNARLANPNCVCLAMPILDHPDLCTLSADVPGTNRPYRTSSYRLQYPDFIIQLCLILNAAKDHWPHSRTPTTTTTTTIIIIIIIIITIILALTSATVAPVPTNTAQNPDTPTTARPTTPVMWT
nr:unnamed protein product [Spirometra erinaceieuropaei]